MLIQCPTCSRVYLGITRREAEQQVIAFNEHYLDLKEAADKLYKHGTIDISEFTLCKVCSTSYKNFTTSINNEAVHTANLILCEEI